MTPLMPQQPCLNKGGFRGVTGTSDRRRTGSVQALAVPTECNGVMLADVDNNDNIEGVMLLLLLLLLCILRRSLCRLNELACNNGGKSGHPMQTGGLR